MRTEKAVVSQDPCEAILNYVKDVYNHNQEVSTVLSSNADPIYLQKIEPIRGIQKYCPEDADSWVVLSIERLSCPECPKPSRELLPWLAEPYDLKKETIAIHRDIPDHRATSALLDENQEDFDEFGDHGDIEVLQLWSRQRHLHQKMQEWQTRHVAWWKKYQERKKLASIYRSFYSLALDLEKDMGSKQLRFGNLFIADRTRKVNYPLLSQVVSIRCDTRAENPRIYVELSGELTEFSMDVFNALVQQRKILWNDKVAHRFALRMDRTDLNPLVWSQILEKVATFPQQLSSKIAVSQEGTFLRDEDYYVLYQNPVLYIQASNTGYIREVESLQGRLQDTDCTVLKTFLGHTLSKKAEKIDRTKLDVADYVAYCNGEDQEILFSKVANKAQLEIARRLDRQDLVVVQGPPGTGKTHTIANIIGNYLARGKRVLVVSQQPKALRVVKDKLPESLQSLCLPLLSDKDVSEKIQRIVEKFVRNYSTQFEDVLKDHIQSHTERRFRLMQELREARNVLYQQRCYRNRPIALEGKEQLLTQWLERLEQRIVENHTELGEMLVQSPLVVTQEQLDCISQVLQNFDPSVEDEMGCGWPETWDVLPKPNDEQIQRYFDYDVSVLHKAIQSQNHVFDAIRNDFFDWCEKYDVDEQYRCIDAFVKRVPPLYQWNVLFDKAMLIHTYDGTQYRISKDKIDSFVHVFEELSAPTKNVQLWQRRARSVVLQSKVYQQRWSSVLQRFRVYAQKVARVYATLGSLNAVCWKGERIQDAVKIEEIYQALRLGKEALAKNGVQKLFGRLLGKPQADQALLNLLLVHQHGVQTLRDYDLALLWVGLQLEYVRLAQDWDRLWGDCDTFTFAKNEDFAFDAERLKKVLEEVKNRFTWYENTISALVNRFQECGVVPALQPMFETLDTARQKYQKALTWWTNDLVEIRDLIVGQKTGQKIVQFLHEIRAHFSKISDHSVLKRKLLGALISDAATYHKTWATVRQFYENKKRYEEKNAALSSLALNLPELAQKIRKYPKEYLHLLNLSSMQRTWRYLKLKRALLPYMQESSQNVLEQIVSLYKCFHNTTEELVSAKAWLHIKRSIPSDSRSLQALKMWAQAMKKYGKGTGKSAPKYLRSAKENLEKAQDVVPVWLMSIDRALQQFADQEKFDLLIMDEASQASITAIPVLLLAKKALIVGDDKQVSPTSIMIRESQITALQKRYLRNVIPDPSTYAANSSLYDIARTRADTALLNEHYRCVPDIISFCNNTFYSGSISQLRNTENVTLQDPLVEVALPAHALDDPDINEAEAKVITRLLATCIEKPRYANKTFGVIVMKSGKTNANQVTLIDSLITKKIGEKKREKHKVICGTASQFQGDERDVIFMSLIDSKPSEELFRLRNDIGMQQRYNVAVSRARDQLFIVHSIEDKQLKESDLRRALLLHVRSPQRQDALIQRVQVLSESIFEKEVAEFLIHKGYKIYQQFEVKPYRIDIVVRSAHKRIAIECDGRQYHSKESQIRKDMERQAVLERNGWTFIRIRGSVFFPNKEKTLEALDATLREKGFYPEQVLERKKGEYSDLTKSILEKMPDIRNEIMTKARQERLSVLSQERGEMYSSI